MAPCGQIIVVLTSARQLKPTYYLYLEVKRSDYRVVMLEYKKKQCSRGK